VLGLSFKPHTDDMRVAPSLILVPYLIKAGAQVVGYDPKATETAKKLFAELEEVEYADTIESAVSEAAVVLALIEWPEITTHEFSRSDAEISGGTAWFIDARNQFDSAKIAAAGYEYLGVGQA
jgi:UDPglucose 6-dehydrogenase